MKFKLICAMIMIPGFLWILPAREPSTLSGVLKPTGLAVAGEYAYVSQGAGFLVFRMADLELLKAVEKKGEGPGEFRFSPQIRSHEGRLHLVDAGKMLTFSLQGDFVSESRPSSRFNAFMYPLLPTGKGYAGMNLDRTKKGFIFNAHIYGEDGGDLGVIYKGGPPNMPPPPPPGSTPRRVPFPVITNYLDLDVWNGKIYIADTRKGFFISVFTLEGKPVKQIRLSHQPQPVTEAYKKQYMEWRSLSPRWETDRKWMDFQYPEVFPAFFAFRVRDERIYAVTYRCRGGKYEVITMDLSGNIRSRRFAFPNPPFERLTQRGPLTREFDISKGILYYLKEDPDTDEWKLGAVPVGGT